MIGDGERKRLEAAYDFLLRVRTDLHYQVIRPTDVLAKSLQPAIAHNLGYTDRSPVRRLEAFMGDLYNHMRNIHLITRTLEQRLALLPQQERRLPSFGEFIRNSRNRFQRQIVDGFKCVNGEIYPVSNRAFRDQPRRLMRVFLYAQQRGLKLHPDVAPQRERFSMSPIQRPICIAREASAREDGRKRPAARERPDGAPQATMTLAPFCLMQLGDCRGLNASALIVGPFAAVIADDGEP